MKLQLDRDIIREIDWAVGEHQRKGGRRILRIDLDDHEWNLFLSEVSRFEDTSDLDYYSNNQRTTYIYKGIEIVKS